MNYIPANPTEKQRKSPSIWKNKKPQEAADGPSVPEI